MESTDKMESGRQNTMLGAAKHSHTISKINSASISSTRVIPVIRTVEIPSPQYFKTDAANFAALVQKLTGKQPAAKKPTGPAGSKEKKTIVGSHSAGKTIVDECSFSKQVIENEYPESAAIERDSWDLEEDGVRTCDGFFELFGGLDNLDFLNILRNPSSTWISYEL